jgi:hydroxyacylglutathione hydrolase
MPNAEVVIVACRQDNYAYLVRSAGGTTVLVDAPAAAPILAALEERAWRLDAVLLTHHHGDHVEGLPELVLKYRPRVIGASADAQRLPKLDRAVADGAHVAVGDLEASVMATPGHTLGHVAYHFAGEGFLFPGDTLFSLGCGRLFEGTAEAMWASLSRLAALPGETLLYPGHEYTAANGRFALTVDPANAALSARLAEVERLRAAGLPTVPSTMAGERATNPFLRAGAPEVAACLGLAGAPAVEVFAELRRRKDRF